jgi:uncharacterized protein (TIGR02284 family)
MPAAFAGCTIDERSTPANEMEASTMDATKVLKNLIQLDIDAIRAYEHAIRAAEHEVVSSRLQEFKGDHERHVRELSEHVRKLGGEPPDKPDLKGFVIEGFTAVTSIGTRSALMAMMGNEQLTTSRYKAALDEELPPDAKGVVERNYGDEQRHLAWIRQALDQKIWEQQGPSAQV